MTTGVWMREFARGYVTWQSLCHLSQPACIGAFLGDELPAKTECSLPWRSQGISNSGSLHGHVGEGPPVNGNTPWLTSILQPTSMDLTELKILSFMRWNSLGTGAIIQAKKRSSVERRFKNAIVSIWKGEVFFWRGATQYFIYRLLIRLWYRTADRNFCLRPYGPHARPLKLRISHLSWSYITRFWLFENRMILGSLKRLCICWSIWPIEWHGRHGYAFFY